jgi:hypothetical protein
MRPSLNNRTEWTREFSKAWEEEDADLLASLLLSYCTDCGKIKRVLWWWIGDHFGCWEKQNDRERYTKGD